MVFGGFCWFILLEPFRDNFLWLLVAMFGSWVLSCLWVAYMGGAALGGPGCWRWWWGMFQLRSFVCWGVVAGFRWSWLRLLHCREAHAGWSFDDGLSFLLHKFYGCMQRLSHFWFEVLRSLRQLIPPGAVDIHASASGCCRWWSEKFLLCGFVCWGLSGCIVVDCRWWFCVSLHAAALRTPLLVLVRVWRIPGIFRWVIRSFPVNFELISRHRHFRGSRIIRQL